MSTQPVLRDLTLERVRLGCWHAEPSEAVREREERLNAALQAIGTG